MKTYMSFLLFPLLIAFLQTPSYQREQGGFNQLNAEKPVAAGIYNSPVSLHAISGQNNSIINCKKVLNEQIKSKAERSIGEQRPLGFEENKGQMMDEEGNAAPY